MTGTPEPDAPRTPEQIRADALTEVMAVANGTLDPDTAALVVDAVLSVCEDEAINRMAEHFVQQSGLRAMQVLDGGGVRMDMVPAREITATWVGCARTMLGDAINYVVVPVGFVDSDEQYEFSLQRVAPGKLTPHQARTRAEGQLGLARDLLARHPRSQVARSILAYLDEAGSLWARSP